MKITPARRVVSEDFAPAQREIATKLAQTLNPFLDQHSQALVKNLTTTDNLKCQSWQSILLPSGTSRTTVTCTLNERPTEIRCTNIAHKDNTDLSAAWSITWSYDSGSIVVKFQGLDGSKDHLVSLIAQV